MSLDTSASATESGAAPRPRRWRIASWAPVIVLVALCIIIGLINPNFFSFGNFVRMSQTAMIPLVLGLGATFIILMGSIDLSVEGILTLGAVILSMLVLNGANANDLGIFGIFIVLAVGASVGFINGVIHVRLKVPSFMTTLGVWFIGVGVANALLGGM
ncbi:MAG: ABC transporter permease, partial [Bauldia litoralis]